MANIINEMKLFETYNYSRPMDLLELKLHYKFNGRPTVIGFLSTVTVGLYRLLYLNFKNNFLNNACLTSCLIYK
jgi:hypothetical protein